MDIVLYLFLFVATLFCFLIGMFGIFTNDAQIKFMFSGVSLVFFAILSIQSLNIELITYDANIPDWVVYRMAEHGYEFLVPMAISIILFLISFFNTWILASTLWNRNLRGVKIPKGF